MGIQIRIEKSILKKKMKISALLIAATNAAPNSIHQWMVDNWWASAVETFNFASNNWDQFQGAVDSVDQSIFPPLFDWCNSNGDSEVSSEELINCSSKGADYFDMPDDYQQFIYKFAQKYWHLVDQDNSGSLNYDEYKYTIAGFAAIDASLILKAFDANANGILDGQELTTWREATAQMFTEWNWQPSEEFIAGAKQAWADSQMDGDDNTATQAELAQFGMRVWNLFLPH